MRCFPTQRAHELAREEPEQRWLVEELWAECGVGIVGGEPKCCKSFLALDLVVSVAAGRACLGRFEVRRPGPVLLFAAEDSQHVVRDRLERIALARGAQLETLEVRVITAPTMRLDVADDRERLRNTVAELRPRLLVLDPFVRLHRIDENSSGEVAPLLAFLRELNREWQLAVLLVHHAKKGGASLRAGQALRGSSEFHAWGDSNLYLSRRRETLGLVVEHRAAPSIDPMHIELCEEAGSLALRLAQAPPQSTRPSSPEERVLDVLRGSADPLSLRLIRERCRMRTTTVGDVLDRLVEEQLVHRHSHGYRLLGDV